jgi:hypothetical protein
MPTPQEEVIRAWEAIVATEATHTTEVCATEVSSQGLTATGEGITALVMDAEDRAAQAVREAWERVSRVEAESTTALASAREEAKGFA